MKKLILLLFLIISIVSCKTETNKETKEVEKELTILEKIANAHGYENWKDVNEIQFSFNVDRDTSHYERNWTWFPKTNDVVFKSNQETIRYNRATLDSITTKTNGRFVNDKYWLLAPFNLVWDKNITHKYLEVSEAPISKEKMRKLTIVYSNEGGYTPGDAYDFYFGEDYLIKEWVFRKANNPEPSLTTAWGDYETIKGLKIAKTHKRETGNWKLYFTDLLVK